MPSLVPVDHDPFAAMPPPAMAADPFSGPPPASDADPFATLGPQPKLVPVDHDPFAAPKLTDTIPAKGGPNAYDTTVDVLKSAAYRGAPEGLAAATPLGFGLNMVAGVADATRWAGGKIYKAATGEELPHYAENPVPYSSEVLNAAVKPLTGGLYEPKTEAGQRTANIVGGIAGGMASGIALPASVGASVASEVSGMATEGTDWEIPARLAGAVLGGAGANRLNDRIAEARRPAVTAADVKRVANERYAALAQRGENLPPAFTNNLLEKAKGTLLTGDDVLDSMKSSKPMRDILDDVELLRGQPMTMQRAQALDERLSEIADGFTDAGRLTKQGFKVVQVRDHLRNMLDDAELGEGFKEARQAWKDQAKLRDIERIIQRAETHDNPTTVIKTGFRNLLMSEKKSKFYTKQELALIENAAKTGVAGGALKLFGSRLISGMIGLAAGGAAGGPVGAGAGVVAAETAAYGLRRGAEALQKGRAAKLSDKITASYREPVPSSNQRLIEHIKNKQIGTLSPMGQALVNAQPERPKAPTRIRITPKKP